MPMRRYAAKKRYKCHCCQWCDDKASVRQAERQMIRRELDDVFAGLPDEDQGFAGSEDQGFAGDPDA